MRAVDSSVAVRALHEDADRHLAALAVVRDRPTIPLQALIETYSTLTRMPQRARLQPNEAAAILEENFRGRVLPGVTPGTALKFVSRLARQGIRGGAIYDAIVAESARAASAILVSADRRAAATYRAIGVEVQMLDE